MPEERTASRLEGVDERRVGRVARVNVDDAIHRLHVIDVRGRVPPEEHAVCGVQPVDVVTCLIRGDDDAVNDSA